MGTKVCDVCKSTNTVLTTRDAISNKHISGWPVIWLCLDCEASVGTYADTETALGPMATRLTRKLRHLAHRAFDPIYLCGFMSRERAGRWIAEQINYTGEFHISQCNDKQLKLLIELSNAYISSKGKHKLEDKRQKTANRRGRDARKLSANNQRYKERRGRNPRFRPSILAENDSSENKGAV